MIGALIAVEREMIPTPIARDARSPKGAARMPNAQGSEPLTVVLGGYPNPTFLEYVMALPQGWTALEPVETQSFHRWRQWLLPNSTNDSGSDQ